MCLFVGVFVGVNVGGGGGGWVGDSVGENPNLQKKKMFFFFEDWDFFSTLGKRSPFH